MNRFVQFVRSLLPSDLTQLVFIAGLVCLTIAPRLGWLPSADLAPSASGAVRGGQTLSDEARREWGSFLSFAIFAFIFAASAGYFTCCWPGKRPARRALLLVVMPAFVGFCAICVKYINLVTAPRSVLQKGSTLGHGPARMVTKLWMLGTGIRFSFVGLVLAAVFALLLLFRKVSLPIAVFRQSAEAAGATNAWRGCKRVIWIFQGAPLLILLPGMLISFLSLSIYSHKVGTWRFHIYEGLAPLIIGITFCGFAFWAMGKENREFIRRQVQLPTLRDAGIALAIPTAMTGSLAFLKYLYDRANWAAFSLPRLDPPQLGEYFAVPDAWTVTLLLAAFPEEVIFRGVLQKHFIERFGLWRGILFVGIIWGAFHFYNDSYHHLSGFGIISALFSRLLFCVVLGFVLSWLTLRTKSLIPSTLAHGLHNIFAYSVPDVSFPGHYWAQLALLALLAYVLFRYWPVETKPDELSSPPAEATATEAAV